jgi:UDP-glucuronate 4-epimerase
VYAAGQAGDVRDTGTDTTKARSHLGFEPKTPLADGLAAEFEWMRAATAAKR